MHVTRDSYERLRPPAPTPADELCKCQRDTPIKLMAALAFNPIHCLACNLEVPPERLGFGRKLADYGAIDALELESGTYEIWARSELLDPTSAPNVEGLQLTRELNRFCRCYFWFWQPDGDDAFEPRATCPVCDGTLGLYEEHIFQQLLCQRDRLVLIGE